MSGATFKQPHNGSAVPRVAAMFSHPINLAWRKICEGVKFAASVTHRMVRDTEAVGASNTCRGRQFDGFLSKAWLSWSDGLRMIPLPGRI
jgi:hypothetical protein